MLGITLYGKGVWGYLVRKYSDVSLSGEDATLAFTMGAKIILLL
jgi:hypothetical protein